MRITNKIMRNNSLYNINQNKIREDYLSNQMTNQSKIVRPSDDPVVAIRALRLRTNVSNITQYHDRNAEDAASWLSITSDAMKTVDEVLTDLYKQAADASNKYLTSDDLKIIMTQMEKLTSEFYASGNVDFAGRYVFSGFRTDTPITFTSADIAKMQEHPLSYTITESFGYEDISTVDFTDYSDLTNEDKVTNQTLYRLRLSYDGIDTNFDTNLEGWGKGLFNFGEPVTDGGSPEKALYTMKDGKYHPVTQPYVLEFGDAEDAYKAINDASLTNGIKIPAATAQIDGSPTKIPTAADLFYADGTPASVAADITIPIVAYIPSEGEIVFDKQMYEKIGEQVEQDKQDAADKPAAEQEAAGRFTITYTKSDWQNGDINPVHYFNCTETETDAEGNLVKTVKYENAEDQDIFYDVGYNQNIQVNTLAHEIFTHDVQRDMDDFTHYWKQLKEVEEEQVKIEDAMKEVPEDSDAYKALQLQLDAVKKAYTYVRDNVQTKFENQITRYQNYLDMNNLATTNNATRQSRLDLIESRLADQKLTFKELQTNNEDIDVTQVAVELSSSELTYQAALMATSKIMQTNLMNYI